MIRVSASLINGIVQIKFANEDSKQEIQLKNIIVIGPQQIGSASQVLVNTTLKPKGSQNDSIVVDVTKTIKGRFDGDGDGEVIVSLDLTPEPEGQPDRHTYRASIEKGLIVSFS
jgi:hypothetical protein